MATDALRRDIDTFLRAHNTLSLATTRAERPWAASVFFASDPALNLYFVTDPKTHHGSDLSHNARVAGTVNGDCERWSEIRGVQLTGTAVQLDAVDRQRALMVYLGKFSEVDQLMRDPQSKQDRLIGERLAVTPFYQLRPDWVRLIDNTRRFGFKQELTLNG
jgi:uncharacterized protein YhbP (UPF0306 family)